MSWSSLRMRRQKSELFMPPTTTPLYWGGTHLAGNVPARTTVQAFGVQVKPRVNEGPKR